ncbi:MAG: S8 family serine peptidase [Candidatus Aenigmarchaeota archaeon]|nr:S8 family serine peptidase [Candidatus Aenigmarchaeota archaeon]MDW8149586.1 S8 family serine peptidase [Candidatus Aenigmarchaeota archaeon]
MGINSNFFTGKKLKLNFFFNSYFSNFNSHKLIFLILFLFSFSFSAKIEQNLLKSIENLNSIDVILVSETELNNGELLIKAENYYYKVKVDKNNVNNFLKDNRIKAIYENKIVRYLRETSLPIMKINLTKNFFKVNGSSINISIIDTGIYPHDELKDRITLQKCFISIAGKKCPPNNVEESDNATDDNGHGTHVAGIAAGVNGVASNASIFAIKVLNASGFGSLIDVIKGINFSVEKGAQIISLSLGSVEDCYYLPIDNIVDELTKTKNVLFIAAAGNSGPNSNTIASPACARSTIAVGAVDRNGMITTFSSRGPTSDNRVKPDLVAVGKNVNSTYLNNEFEIASGTSISTPFITGIAALVYEMFYRVFKEFPNPLLVKSIILTATDGIERNNTYGSGLINAYEALKLVNRSFFRINNTNKTFIVRSLKNDSKVKITLNWLGNANINLSFLNYQIDSNDNVKQLYLEGLSKNYYEVRITTNASENYYLVSNLPFVVNSSVKSPRNKSYNISTIFFNITLDEIVDNIKLFVNDEEYLLINETLYNYYNFSFLTDGYYNATFIIDFDEKSVFFTIDTTKPIVSLITPINGTIYNHSLINFNFTIIENNLDRCWYILNNEVTYIKDCSNFTLQLPENEYFFVLFSNDTAGNINFSNVSFKVSLPPRNLIIGKNSTFIGVGDFLLIFSKWIDLDGLSSAIFSTNETGEWVNYTTINLNNNIEEWINFTWRNSSLEFGSVIAFRIYVNDSYGKESYVETFVKIDNEPPYYTFVNISEAIYERDIYLNISVFDNVNVDKVWIEINFTKSFKNYTAFKDNNVYYFIVGGKNNSAGSIVFFRWHFNDTSGFYNFTEFFNYTVKKFNVLLQLYLNGKQKNLTLEKNDVLNITAIINTNKNLRLEINGSLIERNASFITKILSAREFLEGFKYNVTSFYSDELENYTFSYSTLFFGVCPICPSESFGQCTNRTMEKIYYVCDESTDYLCQQRIDLVSCYIQTTKDKEQKYENYVSEENLTENISYFDNYILFRYLQKNKSFETEIAGIVIKFITVDEVKNSFLKLYETNYSFDLDKIIFRSFKIDTNITKIKNLTIKFFVPLKWVFDNDINKSSIKLYKVVDKGIEEIETKIYNEDEHNIYFESYLSSFSLFLIVGEKNVKCNCPKEVVDLSKCIRKIYDCGPITNFTCVEVIKSFDCKEKKDLKIFIFLITIFVFIFLFVFYLKIKK